VKRVAFLFFNLPSMLTKKLVYFFILFLWILFQSVGTVYSQAGFGIYTGYSSIFNQDSEFSRSGQAQFGYHIGTSIRLNNDEFYFLLGAEFHRFDMLPSSNLSPFKNDQMTLIKGRGGFGLNLLKFKNNNLIRTKIMGSLNFVQNYNSQLLTMPGYQIVNENIAGLVSGLGVDFNWFTIDFEYEHGLFNLFFMQAKTKLNFFNLSMGVFIQ
jgi:hypothetical protein